MLLNQILLFEGTNPNNPDLLDLTDLPHPMLEHLIQILLGDRYLMLSVKEEKVTKSYPIYLLHLYREKSQWQIDGLDLEAEKRRIIPVDNLTDVQPYAVKKRMNKKKISELSKLEEAANLVLDLGPKAIAQFKKYHPLRFSLAYTNPYQTTATLKTFINVHHSEEVTEITNWLLFLGDDIKVKEMPREIAEGLKGRLSVYVP